MKTNYLVGYFGASNTGDEAIAKVISERINCIIPSSEQISDNVNAIIVGGGEYDSWMIEGSTSPMYATGVGLVRDLVGPKRQKELKQFKQLWVRTFQDYRVAKCWGLNPLQGIDSVVLMEPTGEGFKDRDIIIPDWKKEWHDQMDYSLYHNPISIPFHTHEREQPIETFECFNDPQSILNSLVGARRVITWGRLHPHIMAYVAGVPCIDMKPDIKTLAWMEMKEKFSLKQMREMAEKMIESVKNEVN